MMTTIAVIDTEPLWERTN